MVVSTYASNVGELVVNLANRGLIVRLQSEESILGGYVLHLRLTDMKSKKSITQPLNEAEVNAIRDTAVIADALVEKLRKAPA